MRGRMSFHGATRSYCSIPHTAEKTVKLLNPYGFATIRTGISRTKVISHPPASGPGNGPLFGSELNQVYTLEGVRVAESKARSAQGNSRRLKVYSKSTSNLNPINRTPMG